LYVPTHGNGFRLLKFSYCIGLVSGLVDILNRIFDFELRKQFGEAATMQPRSNMPAKLAREKTMAAEEERMVVVNYDHGGDCFLI
jgi:hypothetical protein